MSELPPNRPRRNIDYNPVAYDNACRSLTATHAAIEAASFFSLQPYRDACGNLLIVITEVGGRRPDHREKSQISAVPNGSST